MALRARSKVFLSLALASSACGSDASGPPSSLRPQIIGHWNLSIQYAKPSAICHFVNPTLNIVSETPGLAAGFDADSLICASLAVGVLTSTPDPTGASGQRTNNDLSFRVGVDPLVTQSLDLCGRVVSSDSLTGGLCSTPDYGDSFFGVWTARRLSGP